MVRIFSFLFLFWLLTGQASAQVNLDSLCRRVLRHLETKGSGYQDLDLACRSIGHRLTASENGRKAEDFLYRLLKSKGIEDVRFDSFPVNAWQRESCMLEVVPYKSDNFLSFKAISLANVASADGSWLMLDAGDGLESDLVRLGTKIKGRVLLVNLGLSRQDSGRRNLHRAEKTSLALKYGASGIVFVHPGPGDIRLTGTASLSGELVSIPAVCISAPDGALVRDWMKSERLMAVIKLKNVQKKGGARNVVVHFPARKPTQETIVFTAHYDSWDLATGSLDNGIGSFTLTDLAGALQQVSSSLDRNVVLLWTMGEEQGLLGSRHFVERLRQTNALGSIRMVVNLDMVGNPVAVNDFDWPGIKKQTENVTEFIRRHVPSVSGNAVHSADLHSDHQPFMLEGVPVMSMVSQMPDSLYRCYHADCDDMRSVRKADLEASARAHTVLALWLSQTPRLKARPLAPRKLSHWLQNHGLKEKLQISNEWHWE